MIEREYGTGRKIAIWILRILAVVLVGGSIASTTDANQWWIRIWDFPRIQILIAMILVGVGLFYLKGRYRKWLVLMMALAATWQIWRIWPYTPFAPSEVAKLASSEAQGDQCFSILALNVLQDNRDYAKTIALIERSKADLILLTETDQAWVDALEGALAPYDHRIERPLSNTYGILFASKLPMSNASIQDLAQADTPSVFATLQAGPHAFRMIALHPRPPQPKQDTEERDAEIIVAAKMAQKLKMPVLTLGDFNDVGWSDTTRLFRDLGGFLDPRIGRGTYATFPADYVWLGWPLDYLFMTEEFLLADMRVGENVGSDHRPVHARVCLDPAAARARNERAKGPDAEDEEEASEVMEDFEEDEAKDAVEGEEG